MVIIFIIILLYVSIYDIFHKRIPNFLPAVIAVLGFTYNYLLIGNAGLTNSLLGLITGLTTTLFLYQFARLGAGDVKLITAIGCFVGYQSILIIVAYSYVFSAILGVTFIKLWLPWYQKKKIELSEPSSVKLLSQRIPMGPGISLATFYVLYSTPF